MGRVFPDISPLRESPAFRLLWFGQVISMTGSMVRFVAIPYQVYLLTASPLAVGLIGLFQAVPTIVLSLFGGVIADRVDRRRLLIVTQVCLTATSLVLAVATQLEAVSVPFLYALTAIGASFSALDSPARSALIPTLLERRQVQAAVTLNQTQFQMAAVIGPALAGVLIASFGLATTYWIDVLTYLAAIGALLLMRQTARPPVQHASVLRSLVEGIAFLGVRRILLATMSLDFFATLFGSWRALLPYYADQVFKVGPEGLGLLYAAPGAGALIVALSAGWTNRVERQGLAILAAVTVFGLSVAAFGALPGEGFVLGLLLLAVAQGADTVSSIFRQTILQLEVPDALRGRLNAINMMFVFG
ncbi:MAG TPA: MFS transporter, partial [Candidatus Saccharimonadales bacterium]|nr:MFS transporter [Candidatus Saccharimonadales bacterium]